MAINHKMDAVGQQGDVVDALERAAEWLPVGSLVSLHDAERLYLIAGVMVWDVKGRRFWDYMGYPYPEGISDGTPDAFFDKDMIDSIVQVGLFNQATMAFNLQIGMMSDQFDTARAANEKPGKEG